MDLGLTNATAVVVGGGRGMGLASARCLADDGARIAIIARSRDDLDAATTDLTDRGSPDAVGIVADIRNADHVNGVSPISASDGTANSMCLSTRSARARRAASRI
jgi:3-oxoacyl-[acyl-carrier protein] reductase